MLRRRSDGGPHPAGQQVLIVIGEGLDKARLEEDLRR